MNYNSLDELPQHIKELNNIGRGPGKRAVLATDIDTRGNPGEYRYEHDLQVACFQWAETAVADMPELEMLYAIPNGGKRSRGVAGKLKAEGVKAGVWDTCLDVARGGYHSLKIEMKVGKNTLTDAQTEWGERYARYGHKTAVCYDLASFKAVIVEYLNS